MDKVTLNTNITKKMDLCALIYTSTKSATEGIFVSQVKVNNA